MSEGHENKDDDNDDGINIESTDIILHTVGQYLSVSGIDDVVFLVALK